MPKLPNTDSCCACGACVDACSKGALSITEDKNGFYTIKIEKNKCVECGVCERQCHILHPDLVDWTSFENVQPLAGWTKNVEIIKKSASGGIFAQIAYDFLAEPKSYVYGASLQNDSTVKHIEICDRKDLWKLQNSKYQQSIVIGIYSLVAQRLKNGNRVLFSGVPCQIGALIAFLKCKKINTEELFTIEVICHGVPSNYLHKIGIKEVGAKRLLAYRNKDKSGWLFGANNRVVYELSDGSVLNVSCLSNDFLFRSYLTFSFSRNNCYQCSYSKILRSSDITIGDFWGFEKTENYAIYGNYMGTSVIFPNTPKGKWLVNQSLSLNIIPAKWHEILPLNQNLYMPTNRYVFRGYRHIHLIIKLPRLIRKIILMNGSTNKITNKVYTIAWNILCRKQREMQNKEINKRLKATLNILEK